MPGDQQFESGPAHGAHIQKDGDKWTLVLERDLHHPPEKVWLAITDPVHLREWAPFDASASLAVPGTKVKLTTVNAPNPNITETTITRADPPKLLEYTWGGNDLRWQLETTATGTRLTLWHNIDRRYIAMGAAGWHVCFFVLDHLLGGTPIGRTIGPDAIKFGSWQRLHAEYSKQFAAEA